MQRRHFLIGASAALALVAGGCASTGGDAFSGHRTSGTCGLEAVRVKALGME